MSKEPSQPGVPVALLHKLADLGVYAPDELKAIEVLVDEALARHEEDARRRRRAMFSQIK